MVRPLSSAMAFVWALLVRHACCYAGCALGPRFGLRWIGFGLESGGRGRGRDGRPNVAARRRAAPLPCLAPGEAEANLTRAARALAVGAAPWRFRVLKQFQGCGCGSLDAAPPQCATRGAAISISAGCCQPPGRAGGRPGARVGLEAGLETWLERGLEAGLEVGQGCSQGRAEGRAGGRAGLQAPATWN